MKNNLFRELDFDISILSQNQFENTSKTKLEDIKKDCKIHLDEFKNTKNKGIQILETADIKTNNKFIQAVQQNENKATEKEKKRVENADPDFPYVRAKFMTDAEMQLYHFMLNNLCQKDKIVIFPKVRLGDLVELDARLTTDMKYYWKVTNKHVDYVVCDAKTLDIICVVELDDYTHETKEAKEKDLFIMQVLYTVGIKTVRIRTKIRAISKSDLDLIDDYINTALAPKCPYCGLTMIPRKSMRPDNRGHRFYGCQNYITTCRYTINIDETGEPLP